MAVTLEYSKQIIRALLIRRYSLSLNEEQLNEIAIGFHDSFVESTAHLSEAEADECAFSILRLVRDQSDVDFSKTNFGDQADLADSILIFLASPNAVEEMVGDLMEQAEALLVRKSRCVVLAWFWWRVAGLAVSLIGRAAREKTLLGRLTDALIGRLSR